MRVLSMNRVKGLRVVLMMVPFLAAPAWAGELSAPPTLQASASRGTLLLEVQPPALDGSLYGIRLEVASSPEVPWALGLVTRHGRWTHTLGAQARFSGTDAGDVRLNFAWGAEGRYTLASFAQGTLRPFVGVTAGIEEFSVRPMAGGGVKDHTTAFFVEPTLGILWRPGAGWFGLAARVGPGFTSTDARDLTIETGTLRLRPVYPVSSVSLVAIL
jgi:hypothetical protein